MNTCKECGKRLEDGTLFCTSCGTKIEQKINMRPMTNRIKSKKLPIILIICAVLIMGVALKKDKLMYNYYILKGNTENSELQSVNYYAKALKIRYDQELIDKISEKIKDSDDFEKTLESLRGKLQLGDFNQIYMDACLAKARENFLNKNYETTWNYLKKAESYNYNIEGFEYYGDLVKLDEDNSFKNDDIKNYDNYQAFSTNSDYIIPDSDTRYLTRDELSRYSNEELGFIRNEIFARYGKVFNKDKYRNYFMSKNWYMPDYSVQGNEEELNSIERANLKLIQSLEK